MDALVHGNALYVLLEVSYLETSSSILLFLVCHSGCEEDGKPSEPTLMNIVEPCLVKNFLFYKYIFLADTDILSDFPLKNQTVLGNHFLVNYNINLR